MNCKLCHYLKDIFGEFYCTKTTSYKTDMNTDCMHYKEKVELKDTSYDWGKETEFREIRVDEPMKRPSPAVAGLDYSLDNLKYLAGYIDTLCENPELDLVHSDDSTWEDK